MRRSLINMMDRLMHERGYHSRSDVIRNAIREMYDDNFKEYIDIQRERNEIKKKELEAGNSPSDQEIGNKRKQKEQFEEKKELCEEMGGTVEGDEDSGYVCEYDQYELMNPNYVEKFTHRRNLEEITEDTVENQYNGGDKEELLAIYNDDNQDE